MLLKRLNLEQKRQALERYCQDSDGCQLCTFYNIGNNACLITPSIDEASIDVIDRAYDLFQKGTGGDL